MSILVALAAFAGVMAAFATIVTVLVEGLNKFFALRSSGLREMLRAFHDSVEKIDDGAAPNSNQTASSTDSVHFARQMVENPASSARPWYVSRIPFLNQFVARRFQNLSTLQFTEQLASTKIGDRLASLDRASLKRELLSLANRFERIGEAQSDYFKRRAKLLSVAMAFAFVALANVDALFMFSTFIRDQNLANSTISSLESREFQEASDRAVNQLNSLSNSIGATPTGEGVSAERLDSVQNDVVALRDLFAASQATSNGISALGLPVGGAMFPFCGLASVAGADRASRLTFETETQEFGVRQVWVDPRCTKDAEYVAAHPPGKFWGVAFAQGSAVPHVGLIAPDPFWRRLFTWSGFTWLIGVFVAAGLVGLGAPFWFDIFRRLTGATQGYRAQGPAAPVEPTPTQVRNPNKVDGDSLVQGFENARATIGNAPAPPPADAGPASIANGGVAGQPRRWLR